MSSIATGVWSFLAGIPAPYVAVLALVVFAVLLVIFKAFAFVPKVKILSPLAQTPVSYHHAVLGSVYPPDCPVQVWVRSNDKKMYLHRSIKVDGTKFSAECAFGFEDGLSGKRYEIVAVFGNRIKSSPIDDLPEGTITSNTVEVFRK